MCESGTFRKDLLYRLDTMRITIPPLRERIEEIEPLALRFLSQASVESGALITGITPEAVDLLRAYSWPGNVRELRNVIERAIVIARTNQITGHDLPERIRAAAARPAAAPSRKSPEDAPASAILAAERGDFKSQLQGYEAQIILDALKQTNGNKAEAARRLGIPIRTLTHKMSVYNIKKLGYGAG
jgi:DNA-binding NtrC family response regulator